MKRYFIVSTANVAAEALALGVWHSIDIGSHDEVHAGKHFVVLEDAPGEPPDSWHELPHLLDAVSRTSDEEHARHASALKAVRAPEGATGYRLAKHLATIHPLFKP